MSTNAIVYNPFTQNFDFVGPGGGGIPIETINGDSGSATGSTINLYGNTAPASTGLTFTGSGSTLSLGGILVGANGGTGANNVTTTTGTILRSNGTAFVPTTATYPATTTINQILYSSANNTIGGVTAGNFGVLISSSSGVPSWLANGTTGQLLTATTSGTPSWANPAASSITITGNSGGGLTGNSFTFTGGTTGLTFAGAGTTETLGGILIGANGGTGANNVTTGTGTILRSNGTAFVPTTATYPNTAGTSGNLLTSDGTNWVSSAPATSGTVTTVSVVSANGFAGTVANATTTPAITLTTTQTGLLSGNGTAITGTAITQFNVITGGASNAPNSVVPSATSGVPLISQGSSSQPIFGTAVVAGGGTGVTSFANTSALLASGTTTTGALQNIASVATGQVLVSAGTSTIPAWSDTPTVTSISFGGTALSNYTEGTFTPTMIGNSTAGTTTYTVQAGYYTRIGNMVTVWGNVQGSAATGTGSLVFGGLPFTIKNQGNYAPNGTCDINSSASWTWPAGGTSVAITGVLNSTTANIHISGSAATGGFLQVANAAFSFQYVMSYQI